MRLLLKFDRTISFEGQVNDCLYTTSLYQVTGAYSFYDLILLNTTENLVTVNTSTILATITFQSPMPTNYTNQILFMSKDMHSLLAYASTNKNILNRLNIFLYMQSVEMYIKKLCNPPKGQDQTIINSLISTCISNHNLPLNHDLSHFVNRISNNGKLHKNARCRIHIHQIKMPMRRMLLMPQQHRNIFLINAYCNKCTGATCKQYQRDF